jgi:hypothetical protein
MKKQILIEKYGLSDAVAKQINFLFDCERLRRDNELIRPKSDPIKNKDVIQKVIESGSDLYKPTSDIYAEKYKITQIDFVINGETYTMDDLSAIEQIRQLISKSEINFTPKYRKVSTRPLLKNIAQYIFDNLPESSMYNKQKIAGKIFGEFLKEYQDLTDDKLISKVKNLKNK